MLADEELPPVSWAQLMTMMQNMVKLGESLDGIKATQDATTETLHSLAKQVTKGSKSALKFKEPAIFTGKATQVVGFLQEIKDTLYLLRHSRYFLTSPCQHAKRRCNMVRYQSAILLV